MSDDAERSLPLQELHDAYVERVNFAVSEDREDHIWDLAKAFEREALRRHGGAG